MRWCVEHLDPAGVTVGMQVFREKEQAKQQVRRWHTPTVDGHTAKLTYRTPTPEERARWEPSQFNSMVRQWLDEVARTQGNLDMHSAYREAQDSYMARLRDVERMLYPTPTATIADEPRRRRFRIRRRRDA